MRQRPEFIWDHVIAVVAPAVVVDHEMVLVLTVEVAEVDEEHHPMKDTVDHVQEALVEVVQYHIDNGRMMI